MDCLEASVPPHRRPSQRGHHPPSPPSPAAGHRGGPGTHAGLYGSGVVVAHVASRHTSAQAWATEPPQQQQQQQPQTSSTTSSAAAHASPVVGAEEPADACDSRHPDLCGSPEDSAAAAAAALPPPPPPPAPSTQQQRQLAKYLSLSTCGSSASNLTALGHSTTATASITTAATDSSQQSTPLSGASCHHQQQRQQQQQQQRQQRQRVCVQRTADEEGLPRSHSGSSPHPSPDSRSGSHARDEEGDDNNNSSTAAAAAAAVAAAACARDHRQAHQQHSPDGDLAGSPALASAQQCTSFANKRPRQQPQHSALHHDCGSARMHIPNLSTFADTASPSRHAASKSSSDHAYSAVGGAINTHVFDQVAYEEDEESQQQQQQQQQDSCQDAVRGHGGAQGMALGGGALAAAAVATAGAGLEATPVEPPPKRFAAGEVEVEVAALEKLHHVSTATARAPARTDDEDDSDSREKTSPANSRRHAAQQQQQQRETRSRKSRQSSSAVGSSSSSSSAVLGGRRIPSDSVTARIPYDPASLATPSSQLAGGGGLAPARGASPPRCATPPPPPSAPIALTELRYATLALSFMMRMLCALHEGEPIPSSDFHSHCVPPMSVAMYVERLSRYCACSGEALLCALVLLHAYVTHSGHPVTIFNAHRLLITSVVLGIKLRDDVYYSNIYYARIGGISAREMNKLERLFLEKLDWVTQVQEDEYVALMDLLAKLRIDTPPTAAELEAFALAHPDAVAAYVPTDADAEGGEVATSSDVPLTPEQQARLTVLRGAYHRHQWSTLAVPWMEQQERRVRAKKTADDAAAAAAQEEEGRRWRQYNKEDEEAALRRLQQQQRPASASAWLSPQSVQKTSSASTAAAGATTTAASAWAGEPRYSSEWPAHPQQKSSHHGGSGSSSGGGAAAAAASLPPPAPSSSAASRDVGGAHEPLRYTNFLHFANAAASSYTAASATTAATAADADLARASSQSRVRFHTAATVATAAPERPPRAVSAATTLGIASTTAEHSFISASSFVSDTDVRHGAAMQQQQQQQQSLVAGTAEPSPSSNVPGSGINVNAQPYYYVSSRTRKQQQQQQQQTSSCAASPASVDAPVNRPASATAEGESSARSPSSSSFTSPACLNTIDRRTQNTERSADTSIALSRGIREVVSAMTRVGVFGGGGSADAVDVRQTSGPATTASASSYHVRAFPQRPIAKAGVESGGGSGSDPVTSACMPRWSPPSAQQQQQQQQRRPTFAGQHALGKKRSKPDSYKDY